MDCRPGSLACRCAGAREPGRLRRRERLVLPHAPGLDRHALHRAERSPIEIRRTEDVLAEVLYHLRRTHPEWDGSRITGVRDLIAGTFENGRVDDFVIGGDYRGKDGLDAHVHASAVACGADILLTTNVADFIWDENESPFEVLTPDEFLKRTEGLPPGVYSLVKRPFAKCPREDLNLHAR